MAVAFVPAPANFSIPFTQDECDPDEFPIEYSDS